jgi:recombination DNA repair RAD52 pathway protein
MNLLTPAQVQQLLAPIKPIRVLKDPRGNSHVSQQDVTAHLTRIFGFGNFDTQLLSCECYFEEPRFTYTDKGEPNPITHTTRWDVGYRATFRLTVKNPDGSVLATYEDGSCGEAQNQVRWDAHDNAMKTAISTAKKRCCINLGDQFGLSLYNKGQMTGLVRGTLIVPDGMKPSPQKDVQEGVDKQVSMGIDETEKSPPPTPEQEQNLKDTLGAEVIGEGAPE